MAKENSESTTAFEERQQAPIMNIATGVPDLSQRTAEESEQDTVSNLTGWWFETLGGGYEGETLLDAGENPMYDVIAICNGCEGALLVAADHNGDQDVYGSIRTDGRDEFEFIGAQPELVCRPCVVCAVCRPGEPPATSRRLSRAVAARALSRHAESAGLVASWGGEDDGRMPGPGSQAEDPVGPGGEGAPGAVLPGEGSEQGSGLAQGVHRQGEGPNGPDWELILSVAQRASQRADWVVALAADAARQESAELLRRAQSELARVREVLSAADLIFATELSHAVGGGN